MSNGCCFFYLGPPWLPHKVSRDGWSYKLNSVFNVWQWLHCLNFTAATTGNNDSRVPGNQCKTLFETTLCKLTPPIGIHDCTLQAAQHIPCRKSVELKGTKKVRNQRWKTPHDIWIENNRRSRWIWMRQRSGWFSERDLGNQRQHIPSHNNEETFFAIHTKS